MRHTNSFIILNLLIQILKNGLQFESEVISKKANEQLDQLKRLSFEWTWYT